MVNAMDIVEVGRVFFEPDSGPDVKKSNCSYIR